MQSFSPRSNVVYATASSAGFALRHTNQHGALAHAASFFTMCSISEALIRKQLLLLAHCTHKHATDDGRGGAARPSLLLPMALGLVLFLSQAPPLVGWVVGFAGQVRSVAAQRSRSAPALLLLLLWNALLASPQAAAWLHVLAHEHHSLLPFSPVDGLLAALVAAFGARQLQGVCIAFAVPPSFLSRPSQGPVCQVPARWWPTLHASCSLGTASGCFWVVPVTSAAMCCGALIFA